MSTQEVFIRGFRLSIVSFLQLVMSQVVIYIISLIFPFGETMLNEQPMLFAVFLGIGFTAGIFLTGWLAIRWSWINGPELVLQRLIATLVGAYLPLFAGILISGPLEVGSPYFFVSILLAILGFHLGSLFGGSDETQG